MKKVATGRPFRIFSLRSPTSWKSRRLNCLAGFNWEAGVRKERYR